MGWWGSLEIVDRSQVIAAIAAAIAAIAAAITTWQNHSATKRQEEERHAMVRPQFIVTEITEDRINKKYEFNIVNMGYKILNDVYIKWDGTTEADIEIDKYIDVEGVLSYIIRLNLKLEEDNCKEVRGRIILYYIDVLGKKNEESIDLNFKKVNNRNMDEYFLIIETKLYGSLFN